MGITLRDRSEGEEKGYGRLVAAVQGALFIPTHEVAWSPTQCAGQTSPGLEELEHALSCKYVAADATRTLNMIYQVR